MIDKDALQKAVSKELDIVESKIFDLEKIYLEETSGYGNILRGWDSILNFKHHRQNNLIQPKKTKISEKERLFSLAR